MPEKVSALLEWVALRAIKSGMDHYDFRRASAKAMRMAALKLENGNKSAAAHLIKVSRNKITYGLDD